MCPGMGGSSAALGGLFFSRGQTKTTKTKNTKNKKTAAAAAAAAAVAAAAAAAAAASAAAAAAASSSPAGEVEGASESESKRRSAMDRFMTLVDGRASREEGQACERPGKS